MSTRTYLKTKPIKLGTTMPDGKRSRSHPFIWCIEHLRTDEPKVRLAEHMGVRPQTMFKWLAHCREDRHFSLPLERAIQIGAYFNVPPSLFRPDMLLKTKKAA